MREFMESCLPCQAAQTRTEREPLKPTEFPAGPWQELHVGYKGPIGKEYYLHVLIDQYCKFPVVQVVKSTRRRASLHRTLVWEVLPKDGS